MWSRLAKSPPTYLTTSIYEAICVNNGSLPITSAAFGKIVEPMIAELHHKTPRGTGPDDREVTGLICDALDKVDVEAEIGPPLRSHGGPR